VGLITGSISISSRSFATAGSAIGRSASSCSVVTQSNVSGGITGEEEEEEAAANYRVTVALRTRASTAAAAPDRPQSGDRRQRSVFIYPGANSVKLVPRRRFHRESLFRFEYGWDGELQSRRNRRWYVGAQTRDGLLRTFNSRDHATSFQIVDADAVDSDSVDIESVDGDLDSNTTIAAAEVFAVAAGAGAAQGLFPDTVEHEAIHINIKSTVDTAVVKVPVEINEHSLAQVEVAQPNPQVA
jgi:hypothetical protein